MKLIFNPEAKVGNRVISMTIDGKEIEADKMYKITTNVFTAQGGDNYEVLKKHMKTDVSANPASPTGRTSQII